MTVGPTCDVYGCKGAARSLGQPWPLCRRHLAEVAGEWGRVRCVARPATGRYAATRGRPPYVLQIARGPSADWPPLPWE